MCLIVFIELLGLVQGLFLLLAWLQSPNRQGRAGWFLNLQLGAACLLIGWLALHDSRRLADYPDLIGQDLLPGYLTELVAAKGQVEILLFWI